MEMSDNSAPQQLSFLTWFISLTFWDFIFKLNTRITPGADCKICFLKSLTLVRATIISSVRRTILTPEKFFFQIRLLHFHQFWLLIHIGYDFLLGFWKRKWRSYDSWWQSSKWLANYDNVHLVALSWTNYRDLGLTIVVLERLSGCHQCKMPTGGHNVAITQNQNQNNLQKNNCWKLEELSFDFAEFWECHVVEYPIHWLLDWPHQQANFPTALLCCKILQRIF